VVLVVAGDGPLGDTACLVGWEINGKCFFRYTPLVNVVQYVFNGFSQLSLHSVG